MNHLSSNNKPLTIVDSLTPSNELINQAKAYFGHTPVAWGRYFTTHGSAEYSHARENNSLHQNNIKLLPIARHTPHVGGSKHQGRLDAIQGVKDLFLTFPIEYWKSQGSKFFFFLDVEKTNPLSKEYYEGWSETLVSESQKQSDNSVTILPCVYANYHDNTTLSLLAREKMPCYGLWIARYYSNPKKNRSWDEHFAVPEVIQNSSIPVFLRQYESYKQIHENFDLNQTNPNIENLQEKFLDKLILPPFSN